MTSQRVRYGLEKALPGGFERPPWSGRGLQMVQGGTNIARDSKRGGQASSTAGVRLNSGLDGLKWGIIVYREANFVGVLVGCYYATSRLWPSFFAGSRKGR